jgi:hypothetical protein
MDFKVLFIHENRADRVRNVFCVVGQTMGLMSDEYEYRVA